MSHVEFKKNPSLPCHLYVSSSLVRAPIDPFLLIIDLSAWKPEDARANDWVISSKDDSHRADCMQGPAHAGALLVPKFSPYAQSCHIAVEVIG